MRTCRYHFGDHRSQTLLPFLLFFVSRQKEEWWSKKFFPRGCLSLSRSLRQTKALPRDRNTDDVLSSLTQTLSFRSRRKDNDACVCPRRFPRACVQIRCRPMGKIDPQKLCALSLSCTSLETERRTKNVAREYSLSLDGLATSARLSRSRIRECKEREKRSKICAEISFFSSFLYSPIKCSQFSQRAGESETTTGCEILLFEPNTHREKTTTKTKKKEENFISAYYFRSV